MGGNVRGRDIRRLARRQRALITALELPEPFDVRALCELLGRDRPRPIELCAMELPSGGPSGLWLQTAQADYIVFDSRTSKVHQDHIILHELGHVLCHQRHRGSDALRSLFPALAPELVANALGRSRYTDVEEQEAEIFAHLVLERAGRFPGPVTESFDEEADRVLRNFVAGRNG